MTAATRISGFGLYRDESGIAMVLALGILVVLGIAITSMISYTTGTQRAATLSQGRLTEATYAEGGLNGSYAILTQANSTGGNPAAANLLGCAGASGASDPNGPSNCASPSPKVFCFDGSSTCTLGSADTAAVYGYFSGANAGTFRGIAVPASTWLILSTGYERNPATNTVAAHTAQAMVKVSPLGSGAIAAVWNHVFVTAPLVPNVCALSFGGNSVTITVPLYVVGNMCLGSNGNGTVVKETTQPVDLQVGGKLYLNGNSSIGADAQHPITSAVVVGGCTTVSVSAPTVPCTSTAGYWAKTADTFIPNDAPSLTQSQVAEDYATFDPGPKHPCAAGNNPNPPLAASVLDNDTASNLPNEPNRSAPAFELTPTYSYSCVSQLGASVGQLSWDNTRKKLTINGAIFVDGNLTISQSAYYVGTAVIEVAGTVTFNGNETAVCATSPCNTSANAWQGNSGNNSMLTLAPIASNTAAITFAANSQTFQGSLWTQPSSTLTFVKNSVTVEGPMSIGSFDATFNNATLIPLPVIKNMPVGAPVPPNTNASLSALTFIG